MERHLAQLNIATLLHPIDDPRISDFVAALPLVNGAGEQSTGYVWRLQSDSGDATDIRVFDDPLVIVNLTVWQSLEALKAFAYRGVHREFFRRRAEWFVAGSSRTALWWLPATILPTTDDAKRRIDFIDAVGDSPYAFEMGQHHRELVIEHVGLDDERAQHMLGQLNGENTAVDRLAVAELDDEAVACGGYRLRNDTTAEIRRMFVAQAARGLRIGAALIAELEAAARRDGMQRLLLETSAVDLYEKFGFRRTAGETEQPSSPASMWMEKSLAAEPSRLA
ncbi:MAG: GNAT family N-acetyltransferase [Ilumatobacteraceae bacterium]